MADLTFDTDAMTTAANNYVALAAKFAALRGQLTTEIDQLVTTDWVSGGAQYFQNSLVSEWADMMNHYEKLLESLAEILSQAAGDYDQLYEKANNLKIDAI